MHKSYSRVGSRKGKFLTIHQTKPSQTAIKQRRELRHPSVCLAMLEFDDIAGFSN